MILALDPGLAHVGAALFANDGLLLDADVFTSKPVKRPGKAVGAWYAKDLGRRGTSLATWLRDLLDDREDANESVDTVVIEGVRMGGAMHANSGQTHYGAGVVDSVCSEAVASAAYVTPEWWRSTLGFEPAARPKAPDTQGIKGRRREALLKPWRAECASIKREDDKRLYALLTSLSDAQAGSVAEYVERHGRRGSDVVHALDAFGIGVAWMRAATSRAA